MYPSSKPKDNQENGILGPELNTNDKLREITNFIKKFKIESEAKEEALKQQIAFNEMLQREKENLKKELEDCSKQNSEFRKRTLSYKNKCDGYEEEINNLK